MWILRVPREPRDRPHVHWIVRDGGHTVNGMSLPQLTVP
jgi:hypothetical protein